MEFPTISEITLKTRMAFCTIYLCEVAFLTFTITKANCWPTLENDEDALYFATSNI